MNKMVVLRESCLGEGLFVYMGACAEEGFQDLNVEMKRSRGIVPAFHLGFQLTHRAFSFLSDVYERLFISGGFTHLTSCS